MLLGADLSDPLDQDIVTLIRLFAIMIPREAGMSQVLKSKHMTCMVYFVSDCCNTLIVHEMVRFTCSFRGKAPKKEDSNHIPITPKKKIWYVLVLMFMMLGFAWFC